MTASWRWGIGWAKYISLDGEVLAVLKLSGSDTWTLEGTYDRWYSLDEAVEGIEKRFEPKPKEATA
jgi:hypothetical protein